MNYLVKEDGRGMQDGRMVDACVVHELQEEFFSPQVVAV
jgi:hypothetical protein